MANEGKSKGSKAKRQTQRVLSPEQRMTKLIEKLETRVTADTKALNKKMEFIVEQQAQFATDIQLLRESQAEFQKQVKEAQAAFDVRLGRLAETTLTTFGKLTEAQKATEERLNIFIDVVGSYISRGRNGKP